MATLPLQHRVQSLSPEALLFLLCQRTPVLPSRSCLNVMFLSLLPSCSLGCVIPCLCWGAAMVIVKPGSLQPAWNSFREVHGLFLCLWCLAHPPPRVLGPSGWTHCLVDWVLRMLSPVSLKRVPGYMDTGTYKESLAGGPQSFSSWRHSHLSYPPTPSQP